MPITSSSRSFANMRSTWASHRRPNASRLSTSSSTSTCGGRPGLDRMLGEDPLGEAVHGADGGTVEVHQRGLGLRAPVVRRVASSCTMRSNASRTRARSSLAAASVKVIAAISRIGTPAIEHQRDDAVDQLLGLARARAGLDEQQLVETVGGDATARRVVDERHALTRRPPSGRSSAWYAANSGASTLDSYCASRSTGHTASYVAVPAVVTRSEEGVRLTRHRREPALVDAVDDVADHVAESLLGRGVEPERILGEPSLRRHEPVRRLDVGGAEAADAAASA